MEPIEKRIRKLHQKGFRDLDISTKLGMGAKDVFNIRRKIGIITEEERLNLKRRVKRNKILTASLLVLSAAAGAYFYVVGSNYSTKKSNDATYQDVSSRRKNYERGYELKVESLPQIVLPQLRTQIPANGEVNKKALEQILTQYQNLRRYSVSLVNSYEDKLIRVEPDRAYSNRLTKEAKTSIEHMLKFFNYDWPKNPNVLIEIPRSADEVRVEHGNNLMLYLVAEISLNTQSYFNFKLGESSFTVDSKLPQPIAGESALSLDFYFDGKENKLVAQKNRPIFYSTSLDVTSLVETPAIEVLHKLMEPYVIDHFKEEFKNKTLSKEEVNSITQKIMARSEKFVHALSILWLRRYNKDLGIGLTNTELEERFRKYEEKSIGNSVYNGANALSQKIEKIGIRKSIDIFKSNPEMVFQDL